MGKRKHLEGIPNAGNRSKQRISNFDQLLRFALLLLPIPTQKEYFTASLIEQLNQCLLLANGLVLLKLNGSKQNYW